MALSEQPGKRIEQRIAAVVVWVALGTPAREIVRKCEETWGVGKTQSEEYMRRAKDRLKVQGEQDLQHHRQRHIRICRAVMLEAMKAKNYFAVLKAREDEAKLLGLHHEPSDHDADRKSPEQLRAEIDAYLERRAQPSDRGDAR